MKFIVRSAKHVAAGIVFCAVIVSWCGGSLARAADQELDKKPAIASPLGRFLLVAAEGLYIVEPDLTCSWSHTFQRPEHPSLARFDDLIYDGHMLPNGNIIYGTSRYVREMDREKRTVREFRIKPPAEIKSFALLPEGRLAVLHSDEQAILEIAWAAGETGKVLHRIPVPAEAKTGHYRYGLLRRTPDDTYLVAQRMENRFVEVKRDGTILRSFKVLSLPVVATREPDGSTLCSARVEVTRFNAAGEKIWSFTRTDAAPDFPLIIAGGTATLPDGRLVVVNSDWHYQEPDQNRVQLFAVDADKKVSWMLPASAFAGWKKSWADHASGLIEHRCSLIELIQQRQP